MKNCVKILMVFYCFIGELSAQTNGDKVDFQPLTVIIGRFANGEEVLLPDGNKIRAKAIGTGTAKGTYSLSGALFGRDPLNVGGWIDGYKIEEYSPVDENGDCTDSSKPCQGEDTRGFALTLDEYTGSVDPKTFTQVTTSSENIDNDDCGSNDSNCDDSGSFPPFENSIGIKFSVDKPVDKMEFLYNDLDGSVNVNGEWFASWGDLGDPANTFVAGSSSAGASVVQNMTYTIPDTWENDINGIALNSNNKPILYEVKNPSGGLFKKILTM